MTKQSTFEKIVYAIFDWISGVFIRVIHGNDRLLDIFSKIIEKNSHVAAIVFELLLVIAIIVIVHLMRTNEDVIKGFNAAREKMNGTSPISSPRKPLISKRIRNDMSIVTVVLIFLIVLGK